MKKKILILIIILISICNCSQRKYFIPEKDESYDHEKVNAYKILKPEKGKSNFESINLILENAIDRLNESILKDEYKLFFQRVTYNNTLIMGDFGEFIYNEVEKIIQKKKKLKIVNEIKGNTIVHNYLTIKQYIPPIDGWLQIRYKKKNKYVFLKFTRFNSIHAKEEDSYSVEIHESFFEKTKIIPNDIETKYKNHNIYDEVNFEKDLVIYPHIGNGGTLKVNSKYNIFIETKLTGFVRVFMISPDENIYQIYPSVNNEDNYLTKNTPYNIIPDDKFKFKKKGTYIIKAMLKHEQYDDLKGFNYKTNNKLLHWESLYNLYINKIDGAKLIDNSSAAVIDAVINVIN